MLITPDFDTFQWNAHVDGIPQLAEDVAEGNAIVFNFGLVGTDLFTWLYRSECKLDPEKAALPENKWRKSLYEALDEQDGFHDIVRNSAGDLFASIYCTQAGMVILFAAIEHYRGDVDLLDPEKLRDAVRGVLLDGGDGEAMKGLVAKMIAAGKEATDKISQWTAKITPELSTIAQVMVMAMTQASEMSHESGMLPDDGLDRMGEKGKAISIDQKRAIAGFIQRSKKLKAIMEIVGKLKPLAVSRRTEKVKRAEEVIGVKAGFDLSRIIPSELAGSPEIFAAKFADGELLGWDVEGDEPMGKGPIVILLDSTGSMRGARELYSKAIAWIMCAIAVDEGRHVRIVHWGKDAMKVDDFAPGEENHEKFLASMKFFADDAINQEDKAFDAALDCIMKVSEYKGADIVFLTDGGWGCGGDKRSLEKWEERFPIQMESLGVNKIYTILIEADPGAMPKFLQETMVRVNSIVDEVSLEKIADSVFTI